MIVTEEEKPPESAKKPCEGKRTGVSGNGFTADCELAAIQPANDESGLQLPLLALQSPLSPENEVFRSPRVCGREFAL